MTRIAPAATELEIAQNNMFGSLKLKIFANFCYQFVKLFISLEDIIFYKPIHLGGHP